MDHTYQLRASEAFDLTPDQWRYVIPTKDGFKLYLNEDVFVLFETLMDMAGGTFDVYGFFDAEETFETDWAPRASKERTSRAFRDGDVTCFLNPSDIDQLTQMFRKEVFLARSVRLFRLEEEVMPEELDDDHFEMFLAVAERLGVEYCLSYSENADLLGEIRKSYAKKEARLKPLSQEQLYSVPLRRQGIVKGLAKASGSIAVAIIATQVGHMLVKSPNWWVKAAGAVVIGLASVAGVLFKQQAAVVTEHAFSNPILADGGEDIHYAA